MVVVGITGGIASGKTFVAGHLQCLGAVILDADQMGHAVLQMPEVEQALRDRWGEAVFDTGGHVDRAAVARHVFAPAPDGPPELAFLEQLTHPHIREKMVQELRALATRSDVEMVILDAPILFKAGWDRFCDVILFVDASVETRAARASERGWSVEELERREAAQFSLQIKRERADVVIDNSGTIEETERQVARFWRSRTDFGKK